MNSREPGDWVLTWQTKFHEWAAKDRTLQFHDVFNLVYDRRTLWTAWQHIRANKGSRTAGVDGVTRYAVEERIGVTNFLESIYQELRNGTYRPTPVRQKGIPKKNGKIRYLGIPSLRDRVVQQALRAVLEPILEADFYEGSYAYRPGRRAHDAISEIYRFAHPHSGYQWVIEGDIKACFDFVDHGILMNKLRERITDRKVLRLVKLFLQSGVITEMGERRSTLTGTPQGGIISPLLANLYLSTLDEHYAQRWQEMGRYSSLRQYLRKKGLPTYKLVRFADDFVVLVHGTKEQAEALKAETADLLREHMKMELSPEKTLVTHVEHGFNFLGHRIRVKSKRGKKTLLTYPTKESLMRVKEKVKRITSRATIPLNLGEILAQLNPVLRGWSSYYRYDAAKSTFAYLDYYTWNRVFRWLRKKHHKMSVKRMIARWCPDWEFRDGKTELFRVARVRVERYRGKGTKILHRWNERLIRTERVRFRQLSYEEDRLLEHLSDLLSPGNLMESRMQ